MDSILWSTRKYESLQFQKPHIRRFQILNSFQGIIGLGFKAILVFSQNMNISALPICIYGKLVKSPDGPHCLVAALAMNGKSPPMIVPSQKKVMGNVDFLRLAKCLSRARSLFSGSDSPMGRLMMPAVLSNELEKCMHTLLR
jgi:hypothetical protein